MAKSKQESVLDVAVEFGGVSIGETTARLGVRMDRQNISLGRADEVFCGHRLIGLIKLGRRDDDANQKKFLDDHDYQVDGTFDCKRLSATPSQLGTGLTFSLQDIDVAELAKFSKGIGRIVVRAVEALPDDEADDEGAIQAEPPGTLKSEGPWREVSLDGLFEGAIRKALKKAGINTVGELADYTAIEQRLTDIDSIGPGKAAVIEDRLLQFWADNPQYAEPAKNK